MKRLIFLRESKHNEVLERYNFLTATCLGSYGSNLAAWKNLQDFEYSQVRKSVKSNNVAKEYLIELPNSWLDRKDLSALCKNLVDRICPGLAVVSWFVRDAAVGEDHNLHLVVLFSLRSFASEYAKYTSNFYFDTAGRVSRVAKPGYTLRYAKGDYKVDAEGKKIASASKFTAKDKSYDHPGRKYHVKSLIKQFFEEQDMRDYSLRRQYHIKKIRYSGVVNKKVYYMLKDHAALVAEFYQVYLELASYSKEIKKAARVILQQVYNKQQKAKLIKERIAAVRFGLNKMYNLI
ncbi:hypothetical protein [Culicoidibacter larvae]|uniref:MobA/MobL protein domain-containing protein n=1 Tax=Culicoidibacter larvae TaxID=2579976 RepID=A0A5R8Q6W0_9FIRM|nr:hypothetical protein [Culicoidibacter larvae]TLG71149.1 hypothetical protein FEZ08_11385 [Culicoidibacter larvae]